MCQGNLDMYQERIEAETGRYYGLPIIYFTELIGLACGLISPGMAFTALYRSASSAAAKRAGIGAICRSPELISLGARDK